MSAPTIPLTIIAAVAANRVIGDGHRMPWSLPGDLAHFRRSTMGKPLIVGRRTFESIGGPLPGRSLIVVTRDLGMRVPEGCRVAHDPAAAVSMARAEAADRGVAEVMVAGGGTIYAALMPEAYSLLLTAVDATPPGETLFPAIEPTVWQRVESRLQPRRPEDSADYAFERWVRVQPTSA